MRMPDATRLQPTNVTALTPLLRPSLVPASPRHACFAAVTAALQAGFAHVDVSTTHDNLGTVGRALAAHAEGAAGRMTSPSTSSSRVTAPPPVLAPGEGGGVWITLKIRGCVCASCLVTPGECAVRTSANGLKHPPTGTKKVLSCAFRLVVALAVSLRCLLDCLYVLLLSQHTLNQFRLQQCTTPTEYVSSKLSSPHCPAL